MQTNLLDVFKLLQVLLLYRKEASAIRQIIYSSIRIFSRKYYGELLGDNANADAAANSRAAATTLLTADLEKVVPADVGVEALLWNGEMIASRKETLGLAERVLDRRALKVH